MFLTWSIIDPMIGSPDLPVKIMFTHAGYSRSLHMTCVYNTKGPWISSCVQLDSCCCSLKSLLFFTLGYSMPFINRPTCSTCYSGGSPTVFKHKLHTHLGLESECRHLCSYMQPLWVESWWRLYYWAYVKGIILCNFTKIFNIIQSECSESTNISKPVDKRGR